MRLILVLVALGFLTLATMHVARSEHHGAVVEPSRPPARSPFERTVAGSGVIESLTENVAVAPHVPGVAVEVCVRPGDLVEPGQSLFRLDDRRLQAELRVRQAELNLAKAELARLLAQPRKEQIPPAEAAVRAAEAVLVECQDRHGRLESLGGSRAVSDEARVGARQALRGAEAALARAQAELELIKAGPWAPDVARAKAAVAHAEQQAALVKTEIDRLTVRAAMHGEVLQVNVRPGEFVSTPPAAPPVLMGNLERLHLRVDLDECEIPRFTPGASALGVVKGCPERPLRLAFQRVEPYVIPKRSLTGDIAERVDTRVLQVIYTIETSDTSPPLYVGQRMDVFIDAAREWSAVALDRIHVDDR